MSKPQRAAIEYRQLSELTPYWNNPRNNEQAVDGLVLSIREHGFLVPLVVDKDGVLITGHTRYKAALQMGLDEVPVIVASHLSDAQVRSFRLADNRLSENAKWDENKLSEELRQLGGMGFDLSFTGFSKEELDCLCGMITADCLKEMDYSSVCGEVAPQELRKQETLALTVGRYRTSVRVGVFKAWEADMVQKFPKIADLQAEIYRRLGFSEYNHILEAIMAEEAQKRLEKMKAQAAAPDDANSGAPGDDAPTDNLELAVGSEAGAEE